MLLLALSTGHKLGLGLAGAAFAGFALVVSMLVPRRWPQFPGRGLPWFLAVTAVFFGRKKIAGLTPGRRMVIEGMVAPLNNRAFFYNPVYELLP